MKSSLLVVAVLLAAAQAAWAQPARPHGADGRGQDLRRGPYQDRNASYDGRRPSPDDGRREGFAPRREEEGANQRMSPAERDELRRQIRDHGRNLYRDR